jgi:hypothetical protein
MGPVPVTKMKSPARQPCEYAPRGGAPFLLWITYLAMESYSFLQFVEEVYSGKAFPSRNSGILNQTAHDVRPASNSPSWLAQIFSCFEMSITVSPGVHSLNA